MYDNGLISATKVTAGVHYIQIPQADFRLLCGCPPDVVKHLIRAGLIAPTMVKGVACESGPNAILLSDLGLQNESFANMAEFPVLQMLYRQGTLIPGHPNNTGRKPLLIGDLRELTAQLHYIHRGNYGLLSKQEMMDYGASSQLAEALMEVKLHFAFGAIRDSQALLDVVALDEGHVQLPNQVTIKRLNVNVFQIGFQGQTVDIDLNLMPGESYCPTAVLVPQNIERSYFSIVHSGEGDGWDPERPSMASILMFKGRAYLIDAGPSVLSSLKACGIALNEIEGIFHTHSHDDHFAGLPDLMRTDRRLKYFSAPLIRGSVEKKLAALLGVDDDEMARYFDFVDLAPGQWNDLEGLEVKPVFSPHPVETTVFQFRVRHEGGFKTYTHLADIAPIGLLHGLSRSSTGSNPKLGQLIDAAESAYLEPVGLKKIDIGGGMIHGTADDFTQDTSSKIILAHRAGELTVEQQRIGQRARFGDVDVLIPAQDDYAMAQAARFIGNDFPGLSEQHRNELLTHPIRVLKPATIMIQEGALAEHVFLLLQGYVKKHSFGHRLADALAPGALAGELPVLLNKESLYTYTAESYVTALMIPADVYRAFIQAHQLLPEIERIHGHWRFLAASRLFGEGLSHPTLGRLVRHSRELRMAQDQSLVLSDCDDVFLISSGSANYLSEGILRLRLSEGDFFYGSQLISKTDGHDNVVFCQASQLICLPAKEVLQIPVCRWKLMEANRRLRYGR